MKKTIQENYHIKIEADIFPYTTRKHGREKIAEIEKERCEEMIREIKRHVDGFESVDLKFDTKNICTLCGDDWNEYEDGQPSCCNAAIDEWKKNKKEESE